MRRPVMSRRATLAVLAAVTVAMTPACGVQLDEEPRAIAPDSLPYGLLEPSTTGGDTSSTTPTPLPTFQATSVYLVDNNDVLVEVRRQLPGEVRVAVGSLLTPPTDAEVDGGLRTAIPSTITLHSVAGPEDGLVTIDLTSESGEGSPDVPRLAFAQLVFTATAVEGVDRVLFQVDGQAREVPTGEGQSTAEPLSRADYRQFVRPPATTTVPDVPG